MFENNVTFDKAYRFAIRIVNAYKHLVESKREFVMSKQMLRSGTSIGAIIREAEHAESTKDFVHKLSIGLKEANESKYWLDLLVATDFITNKMYGSLNVDCEELLKLLISSVKTTKLKIK